MDLKYTHLFCCRYVCGGLEYYDKSYDRVSTKNEVPLAGVNRIFHKVTTTDDPIIRKVCTCRIVVLLRWLWCLTFCRSIRGSLVRVTVLACIKLFP